MLPPVPQYPLEVDVYMPTSACPFRSSRAAVDEPQLPHRPYGLRADEAGGHASTSAMPTCQSSPPGCSRTTRRNTRRNAATAPSRSPLQEQMTQSFRRTLLVLLGTAAFVLLIVCASVANLMLARMVRREREVAVRAALGASRTRLLRQLLTESTVLARHRRRDRSRPGVLGACSCSSRTPSASRLARREINIDTNVLFYTSVVSVAHGARSSDPSRPSTAACPSHRRCAKAGASRSAARASATR